LATTTQGTRKTTFGYNSAGFLASITDPLSLKRSHTYDADGHVLSTTLPDGRIVRYGYDANGNLTSATPPGKLAHDFAYTAVDLIASYTPPAISGTGATTYTYNLDRDLTTITRPDRETIKYGYDTAGRVTSIAVPTGTTTYTYNSTTGNLATAVNGVEQIT
jgi:YD repeat-containing protein